MLSVADTDGLSMIVWDTIKASLIKAGLDLRIWASFPSFSAGAKAALRF